MNSFFLSGETIASIPGCPLEEREQIVHDPRDLLEVVVAIVEDEIAHDSPPSLFSNLAREISMAA